MTDSTLYDSFAGWLDQQSARAPEEIIAFSINLYESPFAAELVGSTFYDAEDADWACEEAFVPELRRFELPPSAFGQSWEEALKQVCAMMQRYLNQSAHGARLRRAVAVTVGFVDGDLVRVWPEACP
jgi:hypothetical protein